MKNIFRFLFVVFFLLTIANSLHAQWIQTSGPEGGSINCFAVSGANLFAGTGGGVFLSANNGTSWTAANAGLTNTYVRALAVSGANLFAGTDGGVFLSANNGTSWTAVNIGLADTHVYALAFFGSNLFAGTVGGVFLSANNGTSWTAASTGLPGSSVVYALAVSGANLFAGTNGGVFQSANNGTNWTAVNTGLTNNYVFALAVSGANLFAGTYGNGVFLSANNGTSWSAVNTGLKNTSVFALAASGANLFAGTNGGGVFLSANNGTTWTAVNTGLKNTYVRSLAVSGANLFAGTLGGVFLSANNGTNWSAVNTGLTNTSVFVLAVSGTNLFAGTDGGVFLSANNGTSWTAVNTGLTSTDVRSLAVSGTNLFAGTIGGVFLSANNGTSWTVASIGFTSSSVFALAVSGANLFAGTYGNSVFLSANNGTNWTAVNTGLTNNYVFALAVSGANLFAGTYGGGVFLSTNNGTSWTAVNAGLTNNYVFALAVSGANLFAGTGGGVFLSTNNGTSWTAVNTGLTSTNVRSLAVSGANLFAGTDGGVFLSANNGTNWSAANAGLTNTSVYALAVSGTDLFAGAYYCGVWKRPLSEMTTSFTLSIAKSGSGDGQVRINNILFSLPHAEQVADGSTLSIEAVPASGSAFAGWSGAVTESNPTISLTMNSDKNITASFNVVHRDMNNIWKPQASGVETALWWVDAVSDQVAWIAGNGGVILRTTDGGRTWNNTGGSLNPVGFLCIDAQNSLEAVAAGYSRDAATDIYTALLYKTTDGGGTWVKKYELTNGFINTLKMFDSSKGIALGDPAQSKWLILSTGDGGETWNPQANAPAQKDDELGNFGSCWFSPTQGWFGTSKPRMYALSRRNWVEMHVPPLDEVASLSFDSAGYGLAGSGTGTLARTGDWGKRWEELALPRTGSVSFLTYFQERFWLLLDDQIYQSEDRGTHWKLEASGANYLNHLSFTAKANGVFGWAVGRKGTILYCSPQSTAVTRSRNGTVPQGFALLQNYPNPFNPATTIPFQLSKAMKTCICIYDVNGHLIRRIDGGFLQPGFHQVIWDGKLGNGERAPTGIYTTELSTGPMRIVKKMLLIK